MYAVALESLILGWTQYFKIKRFNENKGHLELHLKQVKQYLF